MIVKAKFVKGFIRDVHPYGCRREVLNQIDYCKKAIGFRGPKKVLIVGASSGFGLATRISVAFGGPEAHTIGVSYETGATDRRIGTAGWYNNIFFKEFAEKKGLVAKNFIEDAFSNETKDKVIKYIKDEFGKIDLFVYSLAAPRRKDYKTGDVYTSRIKTISGDFEGPTIDVERDEITLKKVSSASIEEIEETRKVMGGEDWQEWCEELLYEDCFSDKATTIAYSYIGSPRTYKIYREGTIGIAKKDLEDKAKLINEKLNRVIGGRAFVSVNKALVTKASAYIPTFPLYAAILYKVMKEKNIHENCIMQIERMFSQKIYSNEKIQFDDKGRLRMDDLELRKDVQEEVDRIWSNITPENFKELSDYKGYKKEFMNLNGFDLEEVDYGKDLDIELLRKLEP
ncbi:trans-2-enoyl-CoA reductase [Clostridium acetobutylicum]|nr:trans-2-enoyl-CoA reductase [Clostridium acetobutylicum]